jgi:hypothetical protein
MVVGSTGMPPGSDLREEPEGQDRGLGVGEAAQQPGALPALHSDDDQESGKGQSDSCSSPHLTPPDRP